MGLAWANTHTNTPIYTQRNAHMKLNFRLLFDNFTGTLRWFLIGTTCQCLLLILRARKFGGFNSVQLHTVRFLDWHQVVTVKNMYTCVYEPKTRWQHPSSHHVHVFTTFRHMPTRADKRNCKRTLTSLYFFSHPFIVFMYTNIHIHTRTHIYIYTHTHIYINTYIYTYMYIQVWIPKWI